MQMNDSEQSFTKKLNSNLYELINFAEDKTKDDVLLGEDIFMNPEIFLSNFLGRSQSQDQNNENQDFSSSIPVQPKEARKKTTENKLKQNENTSDSKDIKVIKLVGKKRGRIPHAQLTSVVDINETSTNANNISNISSSKTRRKNRHSKYDYDNIFRKIKVHFTSFIVNYTNYSINKLLPNENIKFEDINYRDKSNTSKDVTKKIKTYSIGEILQMEPTKKNKRKSEIFENTNKQAFDLLYNKIKNPEINCLLDKNYLQFFHEVYFNKNLKGFEGFGRFNDLIEKEKNIEFEKIKSNEKIDLFERQLYIDKINIIAKKEFAKPGSPIFNIKKY